MLRFEKEALDGGDGLLEVSHSELKRIVSIWETEGIKDFKTNSLIMVA